MLHEVTTPQAFAGIKQAGREIWRTNANIAVPDHNVPTTDRSKGIENEESVNEANSWGVRGYIHKPLVLEELEKIVLAELET